MRLRHIGISLGVLAIAGWAPLLHAQEDKFRAWDTNRDMAEYRAQGGHPGNFNALDCNHDGVLDINEFTNRYQCGNQSATAVPVLPQAQDEFARLDRNGDGVIAQNEWFAGTDSFRRVDRNGDGVITRDEYENQSASASPVYGSTYPNAYPNSYPASNTAARFDQLDRNRDGVLTRNEWRGETVSFNTADRNGDRVVTRDEYYALYGGYGAGTYGSTGNYGSYGTYADERFDQLDRNRDGVLTRNEWRGQSVAFNAADRNGDRVITRDEFYSVTGGGTYGRSGTYGSYGDYRRVGNFGTFSNDRDQRFRQYDRSGRGVFTIEDYPDRAAFDILDQNHDGVVTRAEYRDVSHLADVFRSLDLNGDGVVTRDEWRTDSGTFSRMDRNKDGVISRDEFLGM